MSITELRLAADIAWGKATTDHAYTYIGDADGVRLWAYLGDTFGDPCLTNASMCSNTTRPSFEVSINELVGHAEQHPALVSARAMRGPAVTLGGL